MLKRLALLCLTLVFALSAGEVALRLLRYKPGLSSETILNTPTRDLDADVLSVERVFKDASFYRSSQNPRSIAVVALGDSFTMGFPVHPRDSYSSVLERQLKDAGVDAHAVNLGMGDTGPDQQLRVFQKYVLPHVKPDVVVWQFYPNDTFDNAIKPLFTIANGDTLAPLDARSNWMYRRQVLDRAIPLPLIVRRHSYLVNLALRPFEHGLFAQVPAGTDFLDWGRRKIALEIRAMNDLARQHRFRAYYVLIAPQAVYRHDVEPGSVGDRDAIEYQNLRPLFVDRSDFIDARFDPGHDGTPRDPGAELFDDGRRDHSPVGGRHFNEKGYALLGRVVADRILADARTAAPETPSDSIHVIAGPSVVRDWLRSGWSRTETSGGQTYIWSDGPESILQVPLPSESDVRMELACQPFEFPGSSPQTVSVVLNGTPIEQVTLLPALQHYSVVLPKDHLAAGMNRIELRYAHAVRPIDVMPGAGDTRSLAVAWYSIDFVPSR